MVGVRQGEGRHPILPFTRDLQRFAAGGEEAEGGAGREEVIGEGRAGIDQVLAVVEDEQGGLGCEEDGEGRKR